MVKNFSSGVLFVCILLASIVDVVFANDSQEQDVFVSYSSYNSSGRCQTYDPYERVNRKIFVVNGILDSIILRPIAKVYIAGTNDYTKSRVSSFITNIGTPISTINYVIQGDVTSAYKSLWKFILNSSFGLVGFFDISSKLGITVDQTSFGETLASYGVGTGPYLVVPILGGATARSFSDRLFSWWFDPAGYVLHKDATKIIAGVELISKRSDVMPFTDYVSDNSADPYIAIRDAIIQKSESKASYPEDFTCPQ